MTWLRKGFLVFDSLDLGGLICLLICLINSIMGLAFDDERFCFHTMDLSVAVVSADWRANGPGHVP